jgi:hypothetical protein
VVATEAVKAAVVLAAEMADKEGTVEATAAWGKLVEGVVMQVAAGGKAEVKVVAVAKVVATEAVRVAELVVRVAELVVASKVETPQLRRMCLERTPQEGRRQSSRSGPLDTAHTLPLLTGLPGARTNHLAHSTVHRVRHCASKVVGARAVCGERCTMVEWRAPLHGSAADEPSGQ